MHRIRTAAALAALAAAFTLTACGTDTSQGTAERGETPDGQQADTEKADTTGDQPDTELAVGDGFVYDDGVKITVTKISEITEYGQYDQRPTADQTAFRVHWDIENGRKKFLDLDAWGYNAQGATKGGDADMWFAEPGRKEMAGRLAAGKSGSYTSDYALDKSNGTKIVFTMTRIDEELNLLAEDPTWTGDIK